MPDELDRIIRDGNRFHYPYNYKDNWTAPTTSEEWGRMSREAFMRQRGVEPPTDRATQYERILTDLIVELRDTAAVYPGATGRLLREIAGSAEARLREVQGE